MMTYDFDPDAKVIHLKASGVLVKEDPISYFELLDNDKTFEPLAEERIYFTDLHDITFSFKDIQQIRMAFQQFNHGEKISSGVFIVDSDMSYGMARMVISIFEPIFSEFTIKRIA